MAKQKELKFFCCQEIDREINGAGSAIALSNRVRNTSEYRQHFKNADAYEIVGETSPHYLYYTNSIKRIKNTLGIFLL